MPIIPPPTQSQSTIGWTVTRSTVSGLSSSGKLTIDTCTSRSGEDAVSGLPTIRPRAMNRSTAGASRWPPTRTTALCSSLSGCAIS